MKKMTRILAMILVMCMLLMTGCSQESPEDTTPQGEMEENVGNNTADSGTDDAEATSSNDPVPITDPSKEAWANLPEFDSILQEDGKWPLKENGEKYKIGMSMPTVQEEVWQIQMTLIEEDAEKRGYEAVILVADNDADRQIQQLQSLAAQGVDAIWVGAHDASMLGPVLTEIAEMGIPVVSQTRLPVDCPVAYHCNTDNTLLGQLHSQYIVDTLGITSGNFVILKGDARQITDVPQIYAGMMTDIQQYVDSGDINIVLEQNCEDWKAEEAMKHAESALTLADNDIDVFMCMNDSIASGVICGATSFLRNSDKIYEKKRNASQAPGRRFWPSAAARTRTRSWRPLWTRWWPPGSLIVRSVGWRWTTRPTPCDCYCSKWGGM